MCQVEGLFGTPEVQSECVRSRYRVVSGTRTIPEVFTDTLLTFRHYYDRYSVYSNLIIKTQEGNGEEGKK